MDNKSLQGAINHWSPPPGWCGQSQMNNGSYQDTWFTSDSLSSLRSFRQRTRCTGTCGWVPPNNASCVWTFRAEDPSSGSRLVVTNTTDFWSNMLRKAWAWKQATGKHSTSCIFWQARIQKVDASCCWYFQTPRFCLLNFHVCIVREYTSSTTEKTPSFRNNDCCWWTRLKLNFAKLGTCTFLLRMDAFKRAHINCRILQGVGDKRPVPFRQRPFRWPTQIAPCQWSSQSRHSQKPRVSRIY